MNEIAQEVLKRADKIGAWLGGVIDKTTDVATQQAIDIAMQYVAFGRIYHTSAIFHCCCYCCGNYLVVCEIH